MAIYRSDQTQLTFGVEAAQGGAPEMAEGTLVSSGADADLQADVSAGSRTIAINEITSAAFVVGDFIRIGTVPSGSEANAVIEHEIRKIEDISGTQQQGTSPGNTITLTLDRPVAFFHAINEEVKEVNAIGGADARNNVDKYIDQIPGIYETVDLPDPDMSIEPAYFLGTASKRNFTRAYSGNQSYTGAVPDFVLLNGKALRFPIGQVSTTTSNTTGSTLNIATTAAVKGDVFITLDNGSSIVADDYIVIGNDTATTCEVRKVVYKPSTNVCKLDYPLQFAHAIGADVIELASSPTYTHTITETVDLDSLSLHAHMQSSDEDATKNFDRRYYGGKIGSASISAEEGGMLSMSWDGMTFMGMIHNQQTSSNGTITVPFYSLMQTISDSDVQHPTTEPYYFSQGEITMFGQTIARLRTFDISINNNIEANYYINKQLGRHRGPSEVREGRREYTMSASIALPDAGAASTAARTLFNELLLEGDYNSGKTGFAISLVFTRGTSDTITINIPDDGTAAAGSNEQGAFLRSAPHSFGTDNPFQVDVDIIFRNMKITVVDSEHYYP